MHGLRTGRAGSSSRNTYLQLQGHVPAAQGKPAGSCCKSLNERVTNDTDLLTNITSCVPPGRRRGSPWSVGCKKTGGNPSKYQGSYCAVRLLQEQVKALQKHSLDPLTHPISSCCFPMIKVSIINVNAPLSRPLMLRHTSFTISSFQEIVHY